MDWRLHIEDKRQLETTVSLVLGWIRDPACHVGRQHSMGSRTDCNNDGNTFRRGHGSHWGGGASSLRDADEPRKGINRIFSTDPGGRYLFGQLPPSTYSMTIKAKGFETYQQNGMVLNAGQSASQSVTLTLGSETQSVTVTADAGQLNTDNSNVAADTRSEGNRRASAQRA